jgi:hypothetical protein
MSPADSHYEYTQTTTSASKVTSSSSDSSDDDDGPMVKINVKINPKSEASADVDDESKIMNAMRLVDKNLGSFATNPRAPLQVNACLSLPGRNQTFLLLQKLPAIHKSMSIDQVTRRPLPPPPPVPSRPASYDRALPSLLLHPHATLRTRPDSVTTESVDQSNMFPPLHEFDRTPTSTLCVTSTDQDNFFPSFQSTVTESKSHAC